MAKMKQGKKSSKKKSSKKLNLDFTGVEASKLLKPGTYLATVDEVTVETSDNSGEDYLKFVMKTESGATLFHNTSLQPQALWKLRNTLEAMGLEVPNSAMDLDLEELVGQELGVIVENETYQGKTKSRIVDVISVDEVDGEENEEEEEEEDTKKSSKKKKTAKKASGGKIKKGSEVTFDDDGEEYSGKVKSIDGETATVDVDGDEWEIELSDLSLA